MCVYKEGVWEVGKDKGILCGSLWGDKGTLCKEGVREYVRRCWGRILGEIVGGMVICLLWKEIKKWLRKD